MLLIAFRRFLYFTLIIFSSINQRISQLIVFGVGTSVRLATRLYNSGYRTTPRIARLTFVCESCQSKNNSCSMCQRTYERLGACRACKPDVDLDMSPPIKKKKKRKNQHGGGDPDHRSSTPPCLCIARGNHERPRDVYSISKEKKTRKQGWVHASVFSVNRAVGDAIQLSDAIG